MELKDDELKRKGDILVTMGILKKVDEFLGNDPKKRFRRLVDGERHVGDYCLPTGRPAEKLKAWRCPSLGNGGASSGCYYYERGTGCEPMNECK